MQTAISRLAFALVATFPLVACQSSDKGDASSKDVSAAATQIDAGIQDLDRTLKMLHDMVDRPSSDLTAQRKAFEGALSDFESSAKEIIEDAAETKAQGQAYLAEWDQKIAAITDEDMRERSADRREDIQDAFDDAQKEFTDSRETLDRLLGSLRDVSSALKVDTTMGGIGVVKPKMKKIDNDAEDVREDLVDLAERYRKLSATMSRTGPPPTVK